MLSVNGFNTSLIYTVQYVTWQELIQFVNYS